MSSLYRRSGLGPAQKDATQFISSIEADRMLFESVIEINKAHVVMLGRNRIVARKHVRKILRALTQIRAMPKSGEAEDVHVAVEEDVTRRAGSPSGGYLQLAKSRNDQVATAIRMRLRSETLEIMDLLIGLLAELQRTIMRHHRTLMIGRTHMQPAEPTTYGHYLMSFHDAILRDFQRLEEFYTRLNLSPMGACALAGTSVPIDRDMVAALLGFDALVENSLDATGSRDFALEFLADMTQLAVDISRLAEDLVFYMTPEANRLELPRDLSFTSSIMPQKKNPDVVELIRARCTVPIGAFSQTATILHSLPTGYNLDLQEVTPSIWDTCKAMQEVARILRTTISRAKVKPVETDGVIPTLTAATETANILVAELGVPFRLAHQIIASAAIEFMKDKSNNVDLWSQLILQKTREKLGNRYRRLGSRLAKAGNLASLVANKKSIGSPSPRETLRLLRKREINLQRIVKRQSARQRYQLLAKRRLQKEVGRLS